MVGSVDIMSNTSGTSKLHLIVHDRLLRRFVSLMYVG